MTKYTVERLEDFLGADVRTMMFCQDVGRASTEHHEGKLDWHHFDIVDYCKNNRLMICKRDDEFCGVMMSRLFYSILDPKKLVLYQDLLYARPGTSAAYHLMKDFIDYGKANADHLISMIGEKTNIKSQSLEKLGFKKLETLYRMEIK